MKTRRIVLSVTTAACLAAVTPGAAVGCGYHVGIAGGLSTAHASSIPVALALQAAVDAGRLAPLAEAPPPLALLRANGLMRAFAAVLDSAPTGMRAVSLVLIEAHLWGRVVPSAGATGFQAHVGGPSDGDVIVVTGEPALRALLDGRMSWDSAQAAGLVVLDGPAEGRDQLARWLAQRLA